MPFSCGRPVLAERGRKLAWRDLTKPPRYQKNLPTEDAW